MKAIFTQEDFDDIRAKGFKSDTMTCICYAYLSAGKTNDEFKAFVQEAIESKNFHINVSFEVPKELGMPVISKENTPLIDEFVQLIGSVKEESFITILRYFFINLIFIIRLHYITNFNSS